MSSFRAYGHNVLVMVIPPKNSYSKLLVIPDGYKKESNQGIVVQVGHEVRYVEKGSYVVYDPNRGEAITDANGTLFYILPERAISCSIEREPFEVPGLWIQTYEGMDPQEGDCDEYIAATTESIFQLLKEAYLEQPRVVSDVDIKGPDNLIEDDED